jgi:hypothetical protein
MSKAARSEALERKIVELTRNEDPDIATAALLTVVARIYVRHGAPSVIGIQLFREMYALYNRRDRTEEP